MTHEQAHEKLASRPTMTWVPVRDALGRDRMEARWTVAPLGPDLTRLSAPRAA